MEKLSCNRNFKFLRGREMKKYKLIALIFFLIASACGPTTRVPKISEEIAAQEAEKQRELAVLEFVKLYKRLQRIGFRILQANAPLCGKKIRYDWGLVYLSQASISKNYRQAYVNLFGIKNYPTVLYVIPASPAEKAGLKSGDVIYAVNQQHLLPGKKGINTLSQVLKDNHGEKIVLSIKREDKNLNIEIKPVCICNYSIILKNSDQVNAYADGRHVVVFSGMMRFLDSDDELALIIGHELAHNTMGHKQKKAVNRTIGTLLGAIISELTGVNVTRIGAQAGQLIFSQEFEAEADYVGCYYAARAGYDVSGAAQLWRRMAATHPMAINLKGSTHPSTAKRFLAIQKTADEIKRKIKMGEPLIPETKDQ